MYGCGHKDNSTSPSMYPIDSLIRDASQHIEGSAFRGQKVYERHLSQSNPGSAESDVFDEMI